VEILQKKKLLYFVNKMTESFVNLDAFLHTNTHIHCSSLNIDRKEKCFEQNF